MKCMRSAHAPTPASRTRGRAAAAATLATLALVGLTACGGQGEEYNGSFSVANGDSSFYIGDGTYRPETVTAKCSVKNDVVTATISESKSGNTFTTTQPESGSGYAGGTLKLGDGTEYTWTPKADITEEDIHDLSKDAQIFEDPNQDGAPVTWTDNDTFSFGFGLRQATTDNENGRVQVKVPGEVDCSQGGEG